MLLRKCAGTVCDISVLNSGFGSIISVIWYCCGDGIFTRFLDHLCIVPFSPVSMLQIPCPNSLEPPLSPQLSKTTVLCRVSAFFLGSLESISKQEAEGIVGLIWLSPFFQGSQFCLLFKVQKYLFQTYCLVLWLFTLGELVQLLCGSRSRNSNNTLIYFKAKFNHPVSNT